MSHAVYFVSYKRDGVFQDDTIALDSNGQFTIEGACEEPVFIYLALPNTYDDSIVGDMICYRFWAEPGKVTEFHGLEGFGNQEVSNSITHDQYERLDRKRKTLTYNYSNNDKDLQEGQSGRDLPAKHSLEEAIKNLNIEFIKENPDSYLAVVLLNELLNDPRYYEVGNALYNKLGSNVTSTGVGKSTLEILNQLATLQTGGSFPDFTSTDVDNNSIKLSDFRGKYVLIDFWASWCVPCRREHPNLKKLYGKYSHRGFEILGVSLDDSKKDWLNAIKEDRLSWPQVSDLDGLGEVCRKNYM